jgi:hypothetical protein
VSESGYYDEFDSSPPDVGDGAVLNYQDSYQDDLTKKIEYVRAQRQLEVKQAEKYKEKRLCYQARTEFIRERRKDRLAGIKLRRLQLALIKAVKSCRKLKSKCRRRDLQLKEEYERRIAAELRQDESIFDGLQCRKCGYPKTELRPDNTGRHCPKCGEDVDLFDR